MAVYTTHHGEAQREHLSKFTAPAIEAELAIWAVSPEELLDAMNRHMPTRVFFNDTKLAGSVFRGMLKEELSLPIKHPQRSHLEAERIFKEGV